MKNFFKILFVAVLVFTYSCEDKDNSDKFRDDPTTGWIEFITAGTTTGQTSPSVSIPLDVSVPIYENGLNIAYSIEAVEGDFTQFVSSSSGVVYADPADATRNVTVDIALANMEVARDFVTSFDIVLESVDQPGILLGLEEDGITRHRITIPCSNPEVLPGDYFVGDYAIADLDATIGPGNGTENFAAGTVTLAVDPFNPNSRVFTVGVLPAFNGELETVSINFTTDNVVVLGGDVDPSLACSAAGPYIFTPETSGNTPWDICSDDFMTVIYMEDPNGSCGGPYEASFTLTKL
ncbi:hypothetical protein ACU8DI_14005 [Psychroserpens sp. BH13MA-6]